jgi:tRNA threonylcarbamoyladenosine dehydratase
VLFFIFSTEILKQGVKECGMRKELKRRGIKRLKVVYSKEESKVPFEMEEKNDNLGLAHLKQTTAISKSRRNIPGSIAFVPSVVGLILASEVVRDLLRNSS